MMDKLQSKCAAVALAIGLLVCGGLANTQALAAVNDDRDPVETSGEFFYIDNSTGVYYPSILSATTWMLDKKAGNISYGTLNVQVNGKQYSLESYLIDGNNYVKLRDLAYILNGTNKQFDVSWDNVARAINFISDRAYTPVGGELKVSKTKPKIAQRNVNAIYWNTLPTDIRTYNMEGTTYVKIRDVARLFNYYIAWDAGQKQIAMDTKAIYTGD